MKLVKCICEHCQVEWEPSNDKSQFVGYESKIDELCPRCGLRITFICRQEPIDINSYIYGGTI